MYTASWNGTNYGWGGSATTISGASTAGNCYFGGPGYCKVAVDVSALTISYTPTSWAVAGDFNSWSVSANPMTFDPATNVWTATNINFTAGSTYKFVGDPRLGFQFRTGCQGKSAFRWWKYHGCENRLIYCYPGPECRSRKL